VTAAAQEAQSTHRFLVTLDVGAEVRYDHRLEAETVMGQLNAGEYRHGVDVEVLELEESHPGGEPLATSVGDQLPNGATVLMVKRSKRHTTATFSAAAVLALLNREFVTWVVSDATGEADWGHYSGTDLVEAIADFHERG
jgi:hypothetical protein